jgi:hypothetical protein
MTGHASEVTDPQTLAKLAGSRFALGAVRPPDDSFGSNARSFPVVACREKPALGDDPSGVSANDPDGLNKKVDAKCVANAQMAV